MNNKGMTTIELITSFVLASVIFTILFNLTLSLKNIYMDSGVKTNYLIEQANLSREINSKINSQNELYSVEVVDSNDKYIQYNLNIGGIIYPLIIDQNNHKITFDKYTYNYNSKMKIDMDQSKYVSWEGYIAPFIHMKNNLFVIDIPIYMNEYDDNFGVKILYQTNGSEVQVVQ